MDEPDNAGMQNKMFFIVKFFVYNPSSAALYGHVSCAALVANCNKVEWKHRAGTVLVYRGCSFAVAVLIGARFRQDSIRVARLQGVGYLLLMVLVLTQCLSFIFRNVMMTMR